ncbi:Low affinity iron permease [Aureobasidium pullulans]|uniref:Low affinity iron permease n=1 Tax=Aureobasidium pullulans TaxID=5580 RepID=A0A4T0B1Z6_AURPU|nr:Low affinity iron permease [Aureobasidium pullulans]
MNSLANFFCSIGARAAVREAAPTHIPSSQTDQKDEIDATVKSVSINAAKARRLDRWLDKVVAISGSNTVLFFTVAALVAWVLAGIKLSKNTGWQVGISDAQAIINMVFDAFLVRQQLNAHEQGLVVACHLQSRTLTHKRMLCTLSRMEKPQQANSLQRNTLEARADLPTEDMIGRFCNAVSAFMGHVATVTAYVVCIIIWLAFGHYRHWSDVWFFYINTSTSALMVFMLALLANDRERHEKFLNQCATRLMTVDANLEILLRDMTKDSIENEAVIIEASAVSKLQRAINFYADLVGTLLGIALLTLILVVWIVLGPVMKFDANWWLLIGTYAGLIGMNDGFVLKNLSNVCARYEDKHYEQQILDDADLVAIIGAPSSQASESQAVTQADVRFSIAMGNFCSHEYTVAVGLVSILGLLLVASLMRWNEQGQIICNVPPSIIESFFTLILITGHNIVDKQRRANLQSIYQNRLDLISHIRQWQA